jgi:hypothetical protein
MIGCEMELCPNWSGDGRVCPCALFGDPPDPPRCELDYHPPGEDQGVCLARLDEHGNCTRRGGHHDGVTGLWIPSDQSEVSR